MISGEEGHTAGTCLNPVSPLPAHVQSHKEDGDMQKWQEQEDCPSTVGEGGWGKGGGEVCRLSSFPQVFVRFGSADVLLCRCLLQESFLLFHLWPPQTGGWGQTRRYSS